MGSAALSRAKSVTASYHIDSTSFDDHYTTGETLGRGAFGVVKTAALKPKALEALQKDDLEKAQIARRHRFSQRPLAVKIMRHETKSEGDSVDKLEVQIGELQGTIDRMEKQMGSQDLLMDHDELQWHHDYMELLTKKLTEKRNHRTKKTPRENMLREVSLLQKCDHRFIMQHVETFEETSTFCVVFERCYGSVTNRYPEGVKVASTVARNGFQLISAVGYLHSIFILHRDIKPENLMYRSEDDAEVVLGDFGMAVELRKADDRCQGCAGTPHFVPPEGFHSYYQSFPSDCWACGCTLYWMLLGMCPFEVQPGELSRKSQLSKSLQTTGLYALLRSTRMGVVLQGWKPQFEQESTAALARKIVHPREVPIFKDGNGKDLEDGNARELLQYLLSKDPKNRLTAQEALNHQWFAGPAAELGNGQDTQLSLPTPARYQTDPAKKTVPPKEKKPTYAQIVPQNID